MKQTYQKGFTLIEILVTLVLFSLLAIVVTNIMFVSLRASSKGMNVAVVRQAGNSVTSLFSTLVRTANQFEGVGNDTNTPFTKDCTTSASYTYMKTVPNYDNTKETYFMCNSTSLKSTTVSAGTQPNFTGANGDLFDTSGVRIVSCTLTCSQSAGHAPVMSLSFSLNTNTISTLPEKNAPLTFQTEEVVRNY